MTMMMKKATIRINTNHPNKQHQRQLPMMVVVLVVAMVVVVFVVVGCWLFVVGCWLLAVVDVAGWVGPGSPFSLGWIYKASLVRY